MLSNEIALVVQEVGLVKEGMTKLDEIQSAVGIPVAGNLHSRRIKLDSKLVSVEPDPTSNRDAVRCVPGTWSPLASVSQPDSWSSDVKPSKDSGSTSQEQPKAPDAWEPLKCVKCQMVGAFQQELRQLLQRSDESLAAVLHKDGTLEAKHPWVSADPLVTLAAPTSKISDAAGCNEAGLANQLAAPKRRESTASI